MANVGWEIFIYEIMYYTVDFMIIIDHGFFF